MTTAKIDGKGRLLIPTELREKLGLEPGDTMFLDASDSILRAAKATNPLDRLVEEAIGEYEAGQTISLRQFAESEGVELEWSSDGIG